jgi:hypothetical protein
MLGFPSHGEVLEWLIRPVSEPTTKGRPTAVGSAGVEPALKPVSPNGFRGFVPSLVGREAAERATSAGSARR